MHGCSRYIVLIAHLPIFPPLLDHGMEEGQSEDQRLERVVWTVFEGLRGYLVVSVPQVQLEAIGRLGDNL